MTVKALLPLLLHDFRIVLVGPSQAGNVGMIARSCANFECPSLHLVSPEYDRGLPTSTSLERQFAVQEVAQELLSQARVHNTLADALAGCTAAVGFTRRRGVERSESANFMTVGGLANLAAEFSSAESGTAEDAARGGRIALVFGREASGLTSSELLLCTHACEIATSAAQGSMSLPAAVSFALGRSFEEALALETSGLNNELQADDALNSGPAVPRRALGGDTTSKRSAKIRPHGLVGTGSHDILPAAMATIDEMEALMKRWEALMAREGDDDQSSTSPMGIAVPSGGRSVRTARGSRHATKQAKTTAQLRRILQRARPSSRDLRLLHGVLRTLEERLEAEV